MKQVLLLLGTIVCVFANTQESSAQNERNQQVSIADQLMLSNQSYYSLRSYESAIIPSTSRHNQVNYTSEYFDLTRRSKIKANPEAPRGKTGPTYRDDVRGKRRLPNYKGQTSSTTTNSLPTPDNANGSDIPASKRR